jgi:hypothetical protein
MLEQAVLNPPVDDVDTAGFYLHQHVTLLGGWHRHFHILHAEQVLPVSVPLQIKCPLSSNIIPSLFAVSRLVRSINCHW